MNKINIGTIIAHKRKERGITQEELAKYLGVSKPAVSKWESGQSYPDILLLPLLAAYFNLSVDELLGYVAQMTREDVKKLYLRLANAFANEPFDQVYAECRKYIKTYYSCWNLLFAMAQLLVNHAPLAGPPEQADAVWQEAADLFARVEQESDDPVLARQALSMRAYCYLALRQPAETIDLLDGIEESPLSNETLLAKAYTMKGNSGKARSLLQSYLYKNLIGLFGAFPDLMISYSDNPEKMEECLQKAFNLGEVFGLKEMHPSLYFTTYLTAAALFAAQGKTGRALELLEAYVDLATQKNIFPLKLKGNAFFDLLEPFFNTLNLGTSVPRSDKLIRKDLKDILTNNPAFQSLAGEERYHRMVRRLEQSEV